MAGINVTNPVLQPGTPGGDLREEQLFRQERTVGAATTDTLGNSVAGGMWRSVTQAFEREEAQNPDFGKGVFGAVDRISTGVPAMLGLDDDGVEETEWNRSEHFDALTAGVPREYWPDILEETSLPGAQLARENIAADLTRKQRLGMDAGTTAAVSMAVSMADIDLPLIFVSGGAFGAAKVAGKGMYTAALRGGTSGIAMRTGGLVSGLNAGLQAGALLGGLDAANRDTTGWMDAVDMAITTTVFGGALGAMAPKLMMPLRQAQADFRMRVESGAPEIWEASRVRATSANASADAPDELRKPFVMTDEAAPADPSAAPDPENPSGGVPAWRPPEAKDAGAKGMQGPPMFPALVDPAGAVRPQVARHITASRQWMYSSQFDKSALQSSLGKIATSTFMNIGTSDVNRLLTSAAVTANRLAGSIFEIPSGITRGDTATAAVLHDMYFSRSARHLVDENKLATEWAKETGQHQGKLGSRKFGITREGMSSYNRQVVLLENDLAMGIAWPTPTTRAEQIAQDAAMMYNRNTQEVLSYLQGDAGKGDIPASGADLIKPGQGYMPYKHSGSKMLKLIADGELTRKQAVALYADGYIARGTTRDRKLAEAIADAVVGRAIGKATRADDSMIMLFSQDGRAFLENSLRNAGVSRGTVDGLMRRFDADAAERGKASNLKSRNELDLSVRTKLKSGREIQLVDLLDTDLPTIMQRYNRDMAGNAALARKGITSRAERTELIEAIQVEQRAMGEEVIDGDRIRAMFSTFDGGPEHGFAFGRTNEGIGIVSDLKALSSLSAMTFNGFAQMAETGVGIAAVGFSTWYARGIGRVVDRALATGNKGVLDELAVYTGLIGQDHKIFRTHLQTDETVEFTNKSGVVQDAMRGAREWIGKGNYVQGYTSLLNVTRGLQQEVAVLGMADKVARLIKAGNRDAFEFGRMQHDLALNPEHYDAIAELINNGTIEFATMQSKLGPIEYVNRLNIHQWDQQLAEDFAAALVRNQHQVVQKTLAGETSRWMHTETGAALTQFQTHPIAAIQKQFIRNGLQMDSQAVATTLFGLGSAYAALAIRDKITGNNRSDTDRMKAAFAYANVTGWIPTFSDPIMTGLGMPEMRFNGFGEYARPLSVPFVDITNNLYRAPGAALRTMAGNGGKAEDAALRSIPFYRLLESAKRIANM